MQFIKINNFYIKSIFINLLKIKENYKVFFIKKKLLLVFFICFYFAISSSAEEKKILVKENDVIWHTIKKNSEENSDGSSIKWDELEKGFNPNDYLKNPKENKNKNEYALGSLNRSIIFDQYIVGPDISWMVPPGLSWNGIYAFDGSIRGYSRRKKNENFFGFNGGDAVGQFYYQFLRKEKYSFGINFGVRSVYGYESDGVSGSKIGEGLSSGFRYDYMISKNSGFAIGGEQLLHFDGLTDTGRDLYWTFSKGWWKKDQDGVFPLHIATLGIGTGKLAEGNIKGLCSNLLGGSGTELAAQRRLCWAPIFSLARVYSPKHSSFFEYNSKRFILGQSYSPFEEIPLRGTIAIVLSDHIDNYKLHNFDELTWVFRLSLGF